jgi:four helix bundle protein
MSIKTYRDLEAWQAAMTVVEHVYAATKQFPSDERFGLVAQLRRAAVSMPSNIAEGACRKSIGAYANHVSIALGSHAEVETCIEISVRLGYLSRATSDELMVFVGRAGQLFNGLLRSLKSR